MKFYEKSGQRLMIYEYYDIDELDVGCIPYESIHKSLKHEVFLRKPKESIDWQYDFIKKIHSSVLVRFPDYIAYLYEWCMQGRDYKDFFKAYSPEILESFNYLFPSVVKRLDRMTKNCVKLNKGIFSELDFKRIK